MASQINLQNQNANSIYDDNQAQIKIVAKRQYILDDDVVITADNIKKIGELIALLTIRTVMCRSGKDLYRIYDGLIQDCNKSNDSLDEYSDGYDIAQTATLFLCEHIGKRLGGNYTTTRGNVISIKQACFRFTDRYLDKQFTRHLAHTTAISDSVASSHISFIDDESNNDYIYKTIFTHNLIFRFIETCRIGNCRHKFFIYVYTIKISTPNVVTFINNIYQIA